jgi:hypothetical protein
LDPAQIEQQNGRDGVVNDVEGHTVIACLNAMVDGARSFEVVAHEVREDEVLVLGRLAAAGIAKMRFGASQVTGPRIGRFLTILGRLGMLWR